MDTNTKEFFFNFFDDNYSKNIIKKWLYKNSTYVVDLNFEGYHLAFDLSVKDNILNLERIVRDYRLDNKIFKEKKKLLISSSSISDIILFLGNYLKQLIEKINSDFFYKISVIVPVYNRETLILKCIDSLNKQTLKKDDFEVIFVDDYSSDQSISVIKDKIDSDLNYRILKRPINSGSASAPRNDGILAAKGKYIFFLDSDDYIYNYTLKDMLLISEINLSDLVYVQYDGDKGRSWGKRPFAKGSKNQAKYNENHLVRSLMCSKLVRTSILKNNNIFFPLDIKIGEDRVYMMQVLAHSRVISILGDKKYYYITNHDGEKLTNSRSNLEHDYQVVSRVLKNVDDSNLSFVAKRELLSCWFNVVIEAYIVAKLKSRSHSLLSKKAYFEKVFKSFSFYEKLISIEYIYPEFRSAFELFIKNDFEGCLLIAVNK